MLADFDAVPLKVWAKTVLELATASRDTLNKQMERSWEEDRKHGINEHLRPHEVKVGDAAKFILENYEPTRSERMYPNYSVIHGGMQLTNINNQPIYLLRVHDGRVIFQNLADKKFYTQTLEGFSEEQLYSIYALAGEKAKGVIPLTKWVISLAGAVFPVVRYGLMATDVLNAAHKLQKNREAMEREYEALKVAYENIDQMLPGVLPKVWDAVLDKENATLFNPLKNPDLGAWLKVVIRVALMKVARRADAELSTLSNLVWGRLKGAWAAIKKGLKVLGEVAKHAIVVGTAVAGSTGVSGGRALDEAKERLKNLGVVEAIAIVGQIKALPEADKRRLVRELQDHSDSGARLMDLLEASLSW